jgi:hypothetical protein
MSYIGDKIMSLTRQLYPTGRAFKMPFDGYLDSLHKALAVSEEQAYNDAVAIHYSMLPDNDGFTTDDATDWERRLGLISNSLVPLASRKLAILRKLQAPGINPAKGHYLNLERELQLAGFDVYVFENIFGYYPYSSTTLAPQNINPLILSPSQHGDWQHGEVQSHFINNVVANSIDESADWPFNIGDTLRFTFYIGANPIGTYANVLSSRKDEFRQTILRVKQVQDIGYLFINYT